MMWFESHGNLARHPKTRRLMRLMGWSLPCTIGNLHLLWYWALDFAPTGDLTQFEPEQLTYDLDLNGATPEQFIDAMIDAGFIDRIGCGPAESRPGGTMVEAGFLDRESGTLRLHDWPEYTAKTLRPRFRRNPERWHNVLRSYGLPVITRRTSRRDIGASAQEKPASPCSVPAERGNPAIALKSDPAGPNVSQDDCATQPVRQIEPEYAPADTHARLAPARHGGMGVSAIDLPTGQQMAETRQLASEVPRSLSLIPGFVDKWWPKLLAMYETKRTPLDRRQRQDLLARLCFRPNSAIRLLEHCIENSLDCKWEHLENST